MLNQTVGGEGLQSLHRGYNFSPDAYYTFINGEVGSFPGIVTTILKNNELGFDPGTVSILNSLTMLVSFKTVTEVKRKTYYHYVITKNRETYLNRMV